MVSSLLMIGKNYGVSMSDRCKDCGEKLTIEGICPNCQFME